MRHQVPNNKQLVLIALTEGGRMQPKQIREWIVDNGFREEFKSSQGSGAIDALLNERRIVKGNDSRYRLVAGNELRAEDLTASSQEPPDESSGSAVAGNNVVRPLIPCYGMNWYRDQVEWDKRPHELLGSPGWDDSDTRVNFAEQFGVYVLYEWPNVTYVGRTTKGRLYQRLHHHTTDPQKRWFDRFSWFGLLTVGANQELESPREHLDKEEVITAMEAILIEILSPPFNNRRGDFLGTRYSQVRVVDERRADQFRNALA